MNGTMTYIGVANLHFSFVPYMINMVLNPHTLVLPVVLMYCFFPKGPVIRINPDEVHIDDPDFFDQVFNQTNGRAEKPLRVAEAFGPYPAV